MARIFINYRREDADDWAHTVAGRLISEFGRDGVFIDVDADMAPGLDYRSEIENAVTACDLMISVIGRDWRRTMAERGAAHDSGERLDLVRVEIARALSRGIPLIPLLVDRTAMPTSMELPADIADLAYRESRSLRVVSHGDDLDRLVEGVARLFGQRGGGLPTQAPASAAQSSPASGPAPRGVFRDTLTSGGESPEMVVISPGRFLMGSLADEPERGDNEGPQHEVAVARPFALGRYAVTFEEYDAFCAATGSAAPNDENWGRGRRPAINVSWDDATAYCAWLSQQSGASYRLPSEAEWEYACRAGTTTPFWWGSEISPDRSNYDGNEDYAGQGVRGVYRERTEPVDAFEPNPWGLYQMHGNVREWCADAPHGTYDGAPTDGSAWMSGDMSAAVLRGGSWYLAPHHQRSANRYWFLREFRNHFHGFRIARELPI